MPPSRRAVIDVGTNSVKLLVADVEGREVRPIREQSKQTRLGQGFYETHRLRAEAIEATAVAVAAFAGMARTERASSIRVIATSAAREAVNCDELTGAIHRVSGLNVEVISGQQEAEWGFQGVTTDPRLAERPLLLLDVGGGSAQFVFGRNGRLEVRHSFPVGTVRLLEKLRPGEPPKPAELTACRQWLRSFIEKEIQPLFADGRARSPLRTGNDSGRRGQDSVPCLLEAQLVGVGGTATILGCMEAELTAFDRAQLEGTSLSAARVAWHLERLWSLPLEQRKQIVGLPPNRADVILMGAAIYHSVMEVFRFPTLRVSTRGLRFAAVMDPP